MTEIEHMNERILLLENSLRHVMVAIIASFPHIDPLMNSIGMEWDRRLDELNAALKSEKGS